MELKAFEYELPVHLIFGAGKAECIGKEVKKYGKKVLIVTGRGSTKRSGLLDRVEKLLEAEGLEHLLFDEVEPNPLASTAEKGAQIARENGVNDNVIFKWLRLWQNEGRVSRRLPVTTSSDTGVELLPVEITPDEQKEPVAAIAPSLSTSTQTRVSASSCKVEFRHGNMTLENPSPELLTVLIRELTGRGR